MSFFAELKRRNVFRVGIAYALIAWVVLQVLDVVVGVINAPPWVLQLAFFIAFIGLFAVIVVSWVYEMTPEGLKRESEVDRSRSIAAQTGRKLDRVIIATLTLAVAILLADRYLNIANRAQPNAVGQDSGTATDGQDESESDNRSVAVLPFVNMSSDPEQEFFSDGISEEILNALAQVPELKVAGRTSSFSFKDRNEDLRTIGETLGVSHILEGSVRKSGQRVRITAQLVQASDGFHLWSDTFDRELTDVFAIQDEIASAILDALETTLMGHASVASTRTDARAYENYLVARQRIYSRNPQELKLAVGLLDDALAADPEFAPAWAQRGIVELLYSDQHYGTKPVAEAIETARVYIERALSLDPQLAEGWAARGLLYLQSADNQERLQAIEPLERALAVNPALINARNWLQQALSDAGDFAASRRLVEEMFERDPLYPPALANLVNSYAMTGDLDRAEAAIERVRPFIEPRDLSPLEAWVQFWSGDFSGALARTQAALGLSHEDYNFTYIYPHLMNLTLLNDWETIVAMDFPDVGFKVIALEKLGRLEEARMMARQQASVDPRPLINLEVRSGDYDSAIRIYQERWPDLDSFDAFYGGTFGFGYEIMLNLALAFLETGDRASLNAAMRLARATLDRQREQGANTPHFWLNEAAYWALLGDLDRSRKFVAKAVDMNFNITPRISDFMPQLKTLEGDPGYEALQARALEHLNTERREAGLGALELAYSL